MRRSLSETLIDFAAATLTDRVEVAARVRVTGIVIDVPIEVRLRRDQNLSADEWELLGDVPQWRWQTGLEELRGRLRIRWELT